MQVKDGDFAAAIEKLGEGKTHPPSAGLGGSWGNAVAAAPGGLAATPAAEASVFEGLALDGREPNPPAGASIRFPPEPDFFPERRTVERAWWRRALRVSAWLIGILLLKMLWITFGIEQGAGPDTVYRMLLLVNWVVPVWVWFSSRYVVDETTQVARYDPQALADVPVFFENGRVTVYRADDDELGADRCMTPDGRRVGREVKLRQRTDLSLLLPCIMVRPRGSSTLQPAGPEPGLSYACQAMADFGRRLASALSLPVEKILIETEGLSGEVTVVDVGAATLAWIHILGGSAFAIDSVCEAIDLAARGLADDFEVIDDE
jgi:hypothetical protein